MVDDFYEHVFSFLKSRYVRIVLCRYIFKSRLPFSCSCLFYFFIFEIAKKHSTTHTLDLNSCCKVNLSIIVYNFPTIQIGFEIGTYIVDIHTVNLDPGTLILRDLDSYHMSYRQFYWYPTLS